MHRCAATNSTTLSKRAPKSPASTWFGDLSSQASRRIRPIQQILPTTSSSIDAAVRDAAQRDLTVMFTVYRAPSFAEGPDPPGDAPAGSWRVDPQAFGDFGRALASRYSGAFRGLPRSVSSRLERAQPHVPLAPVGGKSPYAADLYRRMVNEFSAAIHAVNPQNVVVAGSTAPYGDPAGGRRMRPLRFLRGLLCVQKKGAKIAAAKCSDRADFDVLSHHPINLSGGPGRSAINPMTPPPPTSNTSSAHSAPLSSWAGSRAGATRYG